MSLPSEPLRDRSHEWVAQNQSFVSGAIRLLLTRLITGTAERPPDTLRDSTDTGLDELARSMSPPPALWRLRDVFQLSSFECDLLLLSAAVELSSEVADACAQLHGDRHRRAPSFALALAVLPSAHWSALSPERPLRRLRLLSMSGESLSEATLRIDERILHELVGAPYLDERLRALVTQPSYARVPARHARATSEVLQGLRASASPRVVLTGGSAASRQAVTGEALASLGRSLLSLRAGEIPIELHERTSLAVLLDRELTLRDAGLLIERPESESAERASAVASLARLLSQPVVFSSGVECADYEASAVRVELPTSDPSGQHALWCEALGALHDGLTPVIDDLSEQFRLAPEEIHAIGSEYRLRALAGLDTPGADGAEHPLRSRARAIGRARFQGLGQVIISRARPEDLVLPAAQAAQIAQIEQHLRHRRMVVREWGFGDRDTRGLGISALFHGASGTGKTLAAEVIAARLFLDLVRVDLSQIVSKYIGETEKNLSRIFDAAERGGVVLLFDEADALFGKRSEVKDSHDRYANIEVGYLLQRMEAFRGLAILTTNLRQSLDTAFLRRLRFVVGFPFPDAPQRTEIWRRVLPAKMPSEELNVEQLSRLHVAGGNIRNIALHAAFLAAGEGEPVRMQHMLRASREECQRLEKTLTLTEVGGW